MNRERFRTFFSSIPFGRAYASAKSILLSKKGRWIVASALAAWISLVVLPFFLSSANGTCKIGSCWIGTGVMIYPDGNEYRGEFLLRKGHGNGEFRSPKGERYLGEWSWGKKNGFGVYRYANGDVYEGHFSNNTKEGMGAFTWKGGGVKYVGNWEDGEPSGPGKLILNQGQLVLEGEYRKGIIYNGKGMFVYENRTRYIGEWKDGKRHGYGILLDSEGSPIYSGLWENDRESKPTRTREKRAS
ncbi:MORN repeat protein [Leptospira inadai serovar Lyme str. 10]|uniref:MORN repeat protein n=2 Tax=Leptospira inadai serovar Lyme TaxID=293084 RepID=V6HE94_9LEPT|nr:hypothetical protein [Leptospira inadai]EQA38656.1 MORN repeat protein [Leptospira inadai serovar Lyme str. 10]PNV72618.1 hypothetical protein BES34_018830 [Leptospira inadai serovar Lyme]